MCASFEMTGGEGTPTLGRGGLGEVCSVPGADHKGLRVLWALLEHLKKELRKLVPSIGEWGSPDLCLVSGEDKHACHNSLGMEPWSAGAFAESFMAGLPEWLLEQHVSGGLCSLGWEVKTGPLASVDTRFQMGRVHSVLGPRGTSGK